MHSAISLGCCFSRKEQIGERRIVLESAVVLCQYLLFSPSNIQAVFENSVEKIRDALSLRKRTCHCCTSLYNSHCYHSGRLLLSRLLEWLGICEWEKGQREVSLNSCNNFCACPFQLSSAPLQNYLIMASEVKTQQENMLHMQVIKMKTGDEVLAFARVRIVLSKQLYLKKQQSFSLLNKCILKQNIDLCFDLPQLSTKEVT